MKDTSARRVNRRWHISGEEYPEFSGFRIESGDGGKESFCIWVSGGFDYFRAGSGLHDLASVHHDDPRADMFHDGEIMRNEKI